MKYAAIIAALLITGCAAQQVTTTAYKAEAATDTAVSTTMTVWGAYVAANHPPATEELKVEKAFNVYQQAELAAIDATTAYANAAGTNSAVAAAQESTALTAASQALADLINMASNFESSTNK